MTKTLALFLLFLLLYTSVCCVCFYGISRRGNGDVQQALSDNMTYYATYTALDEALANLLEYCNSLSDDALKEYISCTDELWDGIELLRGEFTQTTVQAYTKLLERFTDVGNVAVALMQEGDRASALNEYDQAMEIAQLSEEYRRYIEDEVVGATMYRITQINQDAVRMLSMLWIWIAVSFVLLLWIVVKFVRYFLAPIRYLTEKVVDIDFDHLEISPYPRLRRDETGLLIGAFGQMVERLQGQLEELNQKRELERRLEQARVRQAETESKLAKSRIQVFQSQINSHFLFNSLNTVAKLAYVEDAPQAQHAAELIAWFLRRALSQFDREVTFEEEFAFVDLYVDIQKIRFGERIRFQRDLDERCANQKVLSMVLQPLVENALSHGVASFGSGGIVRYYARETEEGIVIGVEDNGLGFSEEHRQVILDSIYNARPISTDHGIGLINVYRRLSIALPGRVEPRLWSVPREKTIVEFLLRRATAQGTLSPENPCQRAVGPLDSQAASGGSGDAVP